LIKLIFADPTSDVAGELWDRVDVVASGRLLYPEAGAAAAAARRRGRIHVSTLRQAVGAIEDLCAELRVIGIDGVLGRAGRAARVARIRRRPPGVRDRRRGSLAGRRQMGGDLAAVVIAYEYTVVPG